MEALKLSFNEPRVARCTGRQGHSTHSTHLINHEHILMTMPDRFINPPPDAPARDETAKSTSPTINRVSNPNMESIPLRPNYASNVGGEELQLDGTGFGNDPKKVQVEFDFGTGGRAPAEITSVDDHLIKLKIPPARPPSFVGACTFHVKIGGVPATPTPSLHYQAAFVLVGGDKPGTLPDAVNVRPGDTVELYNPKGPGSSVKVRFWAETNGTCAPTTFIGDEHAHDVDKGQEPLRLVVAANTNVAKIRVSLTETSPCPKVPPADGGNGTINVGSEPGAPPPHPTPPAPRAR